MLRSVTKTTFAVLAISCLLYEPASAKFMKALKVSPNTTVLGGPVIEVESDGETWTRIKPDSHQLEMRVDIEAGSGWRISSAYIGVPSADFAGTSNQTDAHRRLGGGKDVKSIKRNETHSFHTDDLGFDRQAIINACNGGNHPATQEHTTFSDINVGIKAYFQTRRDAKGPQQAGDDAGRSETADARAPVTIRCLASPSHVDAPPKPVSVDIRVNQKGDTCPKDAEVTAYIDYDKPMTAQFRVIHNGNEPNSAPIEIKARKVSFAGKTWYRVERLERYELDPGNHSFQIKVMGGGLSPVKTLMIDCPPFKVTSAWLAYQVEDKDTCPKKIVEEATIYANRPGDASYRIETQGGLVVAQGIVHTAREGEKYVARRTRTLTMGAFDQMMRLEIVNDHSVGDQKPLKVECIEGLSGKLTLQKLGANSCEGEALVAIHTNDAGELPYELECGPGKSWQRKVTAMANKIGVDKVRFDVTNNEQVTCVLRTRIGGVLKPLDGASKTFQCHKPTGVSGTNDLLPETRPAPQKPHKPGKVVIDPPRKPDAQIADEIVVTGSRISCAKGTVKNGDCTCARTHKPVKAGKNAWRCVRSVVVDPPRKPDDPKPDQASVSELKISCANGTVKNGDCTCARTQKPVKAGKNAWRCVKSVAVGPPSNKGSANKVEVKTAPTNTANPAGSKGKGKTAKKGHGPSASR